MKAISKIWMVGLAMMAMSRIASADHYERIECSARELQSIARGLLSEFRYNYRYHPEYRCLMADASEAHAHSAGIRSMASSRAPASELRREVNCLDGIVDKIHDTLFHSHSQTDQSHFGGYLPNTPPCDERRAKRIVREMENSVRELKNLVSELCHTYDSGPPVLDRDLPDYRLPLGNSWGPIPGIPSDDLRQGQRELYRPRVRFSPSTSRPGNGRPIDDRPGTTVYRRITISNSK